MAKKENHNIPAAYAVGYRRPPTHTQYPPGKSGNPQGRPRGKPNLSTLLLEAIREPVVITVNGRRRKVSVLEAALRQLTKQAATGDLKAFPHLISLVQSVEAQLKSASARSAKDLASADQKALANAVQRIRASKEAQTDEA